MKDFVNKIKHIVLGVFFILAVIMPLRALDWGVLADQNIAVEGMGADNLSDNLKDSLEYSGALIPWLSTQLGERADLYASASFTPSYQYKTWEFIPELLRTEVNLRIKDNGELKIGRMTYTDPLGIVADGLFDGVNYSWDYSDKGSLRFGAWYTGLLYKKTAYITMTVEDLELYYAELDYSDFANTYFAPRRLLGAVDWSYYGILDLAELNCAIIGQADLSGREKLYHSLYFMGKLSFPVKSFVFEAGANAEMSIASERFYLSFAGELGAGWYLPTSIQDKLTLSFLLSNGALLDNHISPFLPISTVPQGGVLRAKLSGLSKISLDYTGRFHETLSLQLTNSYFVLSDLASYEGIVGGKEGYFLGDDLFARVFWSPVSDLYINFGAGVFLPMLGNADKDAGVFWRVELGVKLAFF